MPVSDVPFMVLDSTFSSPIDVKVGYSYVKKDMSDILDVDIIDFPEGYLQDSSNESEQTSLFD